jgi:hypothetical protein
MKNKYLAYAERKTLFACRRLANALGWGALPDFLIVGAQRCGTTSMYDYLVRHPKVLAALRKEVHYFDNHFHRGVSWYRAHFPVPNRFAREGAIRGEASPYYLFHPHAPRRIAGLLPRCRLIVMLRNPVDRAYSHYLHGIRRGYESLPFEEAIATRDRIAEAEEERMLRDESYRSLDHQHYSYLRRGIYHKQIRRYLQLFDREQMLVIVSERFFADTTEAVQCTLAFLGVDDPAWRPKAFPERQSFGPYPPMKPETREKLLDYFRPHNQELCDLLDLTLDWDR